MGYLSFFLLDFLNVFRCPFNGKKLIQKVIFLKGSSFYVFKICSQIFMMFEVKLE